MARGKRPREIDKLDARRAEKYGEEKRERSFLDFALAIHKEDDFQFLDVWRFAERGAIPGYWGKKVMSSFFTIEGLDR